jgi:hypothetical protein
MVFGNGKTHVNAAIGMREYGPFRKIDNPHQIELIFIYQNKDHANNLYLALKKGKAHFNGLLSYVGIPVILAPQNQQLSYSSPETLAEELDTHIVEQLPEAEYTNKLGIIIGPFKKYEADDQEAELYYQVKKKLLVKGIPTQFVSPDTIHSSSFHYSLPNIAIAILAKLGGVPWKLQSEKVNELILGFHAKKLNEQTFIGNTVFFDNEGT